MEKRNTWPDYAKALGIILVVYGHVARGVFNAKQIPINEQWFKLVDSVVYSFHMPLFFFLAGLFFYESLTRWGARGLMLRKVDTIFYPYVLWSLLQGLIEVVLSKYTNGHIELAEVLQFLWQPRAQFWFLYALFFIFALCSLVYIKIDQRYFIVVGAVFALFFLLKDGLPRSVISDAIIANGVYFTLGVLFNEYRHWFEKKCGLLSVGFGVAFIVAQFIFHFIYELNYSVGGLAALSLAVISILFIVLFSMWLQRFNLKWVAALGASSMIIYLMHILAASGTRVVLSKILGVNSVATHLLVGTLAGLSFPFLGQYCINRFGLQFLLVPPRFLGASGLARYTSKSSA